MLIIIFFKFSLQCDYLYSISSHDPFYLEQYLQQGQNLCINTTMEYTSFIFNSLGNASFKTFDINNDERSFGYDEMIKGAAGISFGKITGSLVITNPKTTNSSLLSFISIAAISFPNDECEINIISNQMKNFIFFTFDDNPVCYFNGNGINFRYQFYVSEGIIELRPPRNLSQNIILNHNSDFYSSKVLDVKSIIKKLLFRPSAKKTVNSDNSPSSIFINHNKTYPKEMLDIPSSFVRIDGYTPLIIFKPPPASLSTINKTYFMESGINDRNSYPHRLDSRFIYKEPGILLSSKDKSNDFTDINQSLFYGCDPFIYTYDSNGNKIRIDKTGRTSQSYNTEIMVKRIVTGIFFQLTQIALFFYLFSFCCIFPCCCCHNCCHKAVCCTVKHQYRYQHFDGQRALNFLQSGNNHNGSNSGIDNVNDENSEDNDGYNTSLQNARNNSNNNDYGNNYNYNYNPNYNNVHQSGDSENTNQNQNPAIEEEEAEEDNVVTDDGNDSNEDGHPLQDLDNPPDAK